MFSQQTGHCFCLFRLIVSWRMAFIYVPASRRAYSTDHFALHLLQTLLLPVQQRQTPPPSLGLHSAPHTHSHLLQGEDVGHTVRHGGNGVAVHQELSIIHSN